MDATTYSRLPYWIEMTLTDVRPTTGYHDKYIAPLMETMVFDTRAKPCSSTSILRPQCPADILSNVCVSGRPLLWAVCFFFGPMISDVISMVRIMCQLTSISSYVIFTVIFVTLRCLRRSLFESPSRFDGMKFGGMFPCGVQTQSHYQQI
ncbi:hypothetical protein HD554DRAFT_1582878 [Boletus coccyginus]|nr:hypothetical protein HD554DRAFT_1582878 [Boletus coccyginus]